MADEKYIIIAYHKGWGYELNDSTARGNKEYIKVKVNANEENYPYRILKVENKEYYIVVVEFPLNFAQEFAIKVMDAIKDKYSFTGTNSLAFLHGRGEPFKDDYKLSNIPTNIYSGDSSYAYYLLDLIFKKDGYRGPKTETEEKKEFPEWTKLEEEIKKKDLIKPLSLLKHRIAHLWLPLDIDLQGIQEVKKKQSNDKAIEYLEDVLKGKDDKFYRRKLADLWYMVVKGKIENGKWKIDNNEKKIEDEKLIMECGGDKKIEFVPVPPRDKFDELSLEGKAIIDLIDEKKDDKEVKKHWTNLLDICGLNYDEKAPFKKSEIYPLSSIFKSQNSAILEFMCYLDCLIQNWCKMSKDRKSGAVVKVLNFEGLSKFISKLSLIINLPSSTLPFYDWFVALDDCLDKLREKIAEEEEKRWKN